jgi:hypothetical protein
MNTVFSHIVQKRLAQENENVATEALTFILESSDEARRGLMNLLRRIVPGLPDLRFHAQQTEDAARPDMCGLDGNRLRVLVENKFWAGLTDNQPVEYLKSLAKTAECTVLLMVVPAKRQESIWRELERRLGSLPSTDEPSSGGMRVVTTRIGPMLAVVSWKQLLDALEAELTNEQRRNDVVQLRALCDSVDQDGFIPFSATQVTDQQTAAFILQLNVIIQGAVERGISGRFLDTKGLLPTHSWESIGRYFRFTESSVGGWLGTEFRLWKDHGSTPLWLFFDDSEFGRAREVRSILKTWADRKGVPAISLKNDFAVGIDLVTGQEEKAVIDFVAGRLKEIAEEPELPQPSD